MSVEEGGGSNGGRNSEGLWGRSPPMVELGEVIEGLLNNMKRICKI